MFTGRHRSDHLLPGLENYGVGRFCDHKRGGLFFGGPEGFAVLIVIQFFPNPGKRARFASRATKWFARNDLGKMGLHSWEAAQASGRRPKHDVIAWHTAH